MPPARDPVTHGLVLRPDEIDYTNMREIGNIVIAHGARGVRISVEGFIFPEAVSCRQNTVKALAWARDVIDAEIRKNTLIPGGHLTSVAE